MPRGFTDYDTAQIQQQLWTPEVLRPAVWYDADDLSTISVATGVSEWRDKSGNNRHATQSTAASQPALSINSFNGRNTLLFDGADDRLFYDGTFLASKSYLVCCAFARRTTSQTYCLGGSTSSTNNNLHFGYRANSTFTLAQYANDLDGSVSAYSAPPVLSIGVGRKLIAAGGGTILRFNGSTIATNTNTTGLSANAGAAIGWFSAGFPNYYNMNAAEIVLFAVTDESQISDAMINFIEGYLSWKWGIRLAANHPYVNRPPLIGD